MESIFFEFIFFVAIKKRLEEALFIALQKIKFGKNLEMESWKWVLIIFRFVSRQILQIELISLLPWITN
jgi:hypothetical protein